jgi:TetR/AcrR family transcriptional regulator, cholesterol catabolism regulator
VEAACNVFFKKGFHGTKVREIAAEAGMSIGQLYHYISCKDDILFLVVKHVQELWYDHLVAFGFEETEGAEKQLAKALRAGIEFTAKHKRLLHFIFTESKYLDEKHKKFVLKMDDRNVTGFYRSLLEKISRTQYLDCDLDLAARLIPFITLFTALRGRQLKDCALGDAVDFLVTFIQKGLGFPEK